jgi:histidine triad (HIT) family protein
VRNKSECVFCRIAAGHVPEVEIVCESDAWVAFFPESPATAGHTLVIPRAHIANLWEGDETIGAELGGAVVRVGRAIREALSPDGLNLITSAGTAAEQTIFHAHLHVVPRWEHDPIGPIWPPKHRMDEERAEDLAAQIRARC